MIKINNIYANILTIMGLFVSVFSLVMVNFTNISSNQITKEYIVPMNISLGIVITLFIGFLRFCKCSRCCRYRKCRNKFFDPNIIMWYDKRIEQV